MKALSEEEVGYRKPPTSTRFKKGQSGNPRGRPKGRKSPIPYDTVLGQIVTIQENGQSRQVTAAEAFVLRLTKQGLEGDSGARKLILTLMQEVEATPSSYRRPASKIILKAVAPGSVTGALEPLRMGRKLDRERPSARMVLEPWIVEAALERMGNRQLTPKQQREVLKVTRTPKKVKWPTWWTKLPK